MVTVLFVGWLGFCVMLNGSGLGVTWGQMAVPLVSLLAQLIIYAALAVFLSMVLPNRNMAAMGTGLVLVISYFMTSLVFLDQRLEMVAKFLPHQYYQTVLSFQELNLTWLFGLLGISALLAVLSWLLFTRRDIRLGGEGSWQLPKMFARH
jgi:ABC-2 type transport system permease protein